MLNKFIWVFAIVVIVAGIGYYLGHSASPTSLKFGEALIDEPLSLDSRTKDSGCVIDGPFPDHACTPGAVFPDATKDQICVSGYTKTVRNVPLSLKKRVYREYGISYPQPRGSYEADHFIPLELGGSNDIANLFPEAAEPQPGFHQKDVVENYLHEQVCSGKMTLSAAQMKISRNWLEVYNSIDPSVVDYLLKKYKNWSTN